MSLNIRLAESGVLMPGDLALKQINTESVRFSMVTEVSPPTPNKLTTARYSKNVKLF